MIKESSTNDSIEEALSKQPSTNYNNGGCSDSSFRKVVKRYNPLTKGDGVECNKQVNFEVFNFSESIEDVSYSRTERLRRLYMPEVKNCCYRKCSQVTLNSRTISRILEMKRNKSKFQLKQDLLDQLYAQRNVEGVSVGGFIICGQYLCKESARAVFGLSKYMINEVFEAFSCGQRFFVHGNTQGMTMKPSTIGFICWMKQFAFNYGNYSPDEEGVIVISACFTIKDVYNMYTLQAPEPRVSKSYFYALFNSKFGLKRDDKSLPHIRISSYSTHSRCDQCLILEKLQKCCKSEEDLAIIKSFKQEHRLVYSRARLAIEEKRMKSLTDSSGHVYVQIDDMDNHKVSVSFILAVY